MRTTVNLTTRSDTGTVNSSPVSAMQPIVRIQHGCNATIEIPGDVESGCKDFIGRGLNVNVYTVDSRYLDLAYLE